MGEKSGTQERYITIHECVTFEAKRNISPHAVPINIRQQKSESHFKMAFHKQEKQRSIEIVRLVGQKNRATAQILCVREIEIQLNVDGISGRASFLKRLR